MIDIRKITNGYWWDAQSKFDAIVNGETSLKELTLQLTDRCNLNCPKCNKINFTFEDMKTSDIMRILTEACELGLKHVHFTGGEPTLHPDYINIIRFCRNKGLRVDMSTNGMFSLIQTIQMIGSGIDSINVSWDFLDKIPTCVSFMKDIKTRWFINHMVMPSNYEELPKFLEILGSKEYDSVIDIQLMPPRGTAEKFTEDQILKFNRNIAPECYILSDARFPMVKGKILEILTNKEASKGIYHHTIKWPCHRSKVELRVGTKGFTTCTYLYRDGHITCGLENSVKDALRKCVQECKGSPPIPSMCQYSCSPEVADFNYLVEKKLKGELI